MPGRVHQNDAPSLSLASSIAAGDTTIPVNESITGVETPISYIINSGGASEEIVTLVDKNTSTSPSKFGNCIRGCDGTTAQSHASGEVLTHEATARDFVDKNVVHSQLYAEKRVVAAADFDVDGPVNADGYQIKTGQTISVESGSGEIDNGVLTPTSTRFIARINLDVGAHVVRPIIKTPGGITDVVGSIIDWQDIDNYWIQTAHRFNSSGRFGLFQVSSGSESIIGESTLSTQNIGNLVYRPTIHIGGSPITCYAFGKRVFDNGVNPNKKDIGFISDNLSARFYGISAYR